MSNSMSIPLFQFAPSKNVLRQSSVNRFGLASRALAIQSDDQLVKVRRFLQEPHEKWQARASPEASQNWSSPTRSTKIG
jgi:hypothetical protein